MARPLPDPDEVQTPARIALAALERICSQSEKFDRIHGDQAIVSRFLYDVEIELEAARSVAVYRESQATIASGRVLELDRKLSAAKSALHGCSLELAALATSATALCDRLEDLDAGDLCLEMRAVRIALSGERIETLVSFLADAYPEAQVRTALRKLCKNLELSSEATSAAERSVLEQLRRKAVPWWSTSSSASCSS